MVIEMNRSLTEVLSEVLVFPYEQSIVESLELSCSNYVDNIDIDKYEDCVLHLCLDIPSEDLIQSIDDQTHRKYPNRVYRALAGYIINKTLATLTEGIDTVMYVLALRNVLKVKNDDANGIICKVIDPACFAKVEDYWLCNIGIPSIQKNGFVTSILGAETWSDTELDIEISFSDIQSITKFYCREQFKKKYSNLKVENNQGSYDFAVQVANEIAKQDWLFTVEKPYDIFKSLGIKGSAISLSNIRDRIQVKQGENEENISPVSVFIRYLHTHEYDEVGTHRFSPQNFGIAYFYELLYERLKSENYE